MTLEAIIAITVPATAGIVVVATMFIRSTSREVLRSELSATLKGEFAIFEISLRNTLDNLYVSRSEFYQCRTDHGRGETS